ncbi:MAG TPA: magnesium transporter CorA family protein [Gammaproteobacteria bacterium]|nr:magnesium transporter CorA family protein [Gammaproteobacteria bacterium]
MIAGFAPSGGRLRPVGESLADLAGLVWIDLLNPSAEEETMLEAQLGVDIPTREEMQRLEVSGRLYREEEAVVMTATLPARTDSDDLLMAPVAFVIVGGKLITVRYHEPRVFKTFPQRAGESNLGCANGETVFVALLEATVDRMTDVLERAEEEVDTISRAIFRTDQTKSVSPDLMNTLQLIGRKGDLCSNIRVCVLSLQRLAGFWGQILADKSNSKEMRGRVRTLEHYLESLGDHSSFVSQKVTFLLDATLGMINIEQSNIIKIFSIAAGVFLPPTLIASIYGMNFAFMPELKWVYGYPFAAVLMLASALLPFWYFKRRGWL